MMENDVKHEIEQCDTAVETYWRDLDKFDREMNWDEYQESLKQSFADSLKGSLGKDIQDVTSGKIKVKLPFKMKVKRWFENLFKIF